MDQNLFASSTNIKPTTGREWHHSQSMNPRIRGMMITAVGVYRKTSPQLHPAPDPP